MKTFLICLGAIFIFCSIIFAETLTKAQYIVEYNNPSIIKKCPDRFIIKYENEEGTTSLKSLSFVDMSDDLKAYLGVKQEERDNKAVKSNTNSKAVGQDKDNGTKTSLDTDKIKENVNRSNEYIIIPNGWVYNLKGTNIQIHERNRDDVYKKYDKYTVINGEVYILDSSSYNYVDDYYEQLKSALDDINNKISELKKEKQNRLKSAGYTNRHASTSNDEAYSNQRQNIENDYNEQLKNLKEQTNYSSISSMVSKLKRYAQ